MNSSVMGFCRQEYWSGLPFSSFGVSPTQGSHLHLLHWLADSFPLSYREAQRYLCCCSVAQSDKSFWLFDPHGLHHTRLPCPPLSPSVYSSSCSLSPWCYLTISCSAALFSFCQGTCILRQFLIGNFSIRKGGVLQLMWPFICCIYWFFLMSVNKFLSSLLLTSK